MAETRRPSTTTLRATGGDDVAIVVPDEVVAASDRGRRVPVVVGVDDHTWRSGIVSRAGLRAPAPPRARSVPRGPRTRVSDASRARRLEELLEALRAT